MEAGLTEDCEFNSLFLEEVEWPFSIAEFLQSSLFLDCFPDFWIWDFFSVVDVVIRPCSVWIASSSDQVFCCLSHILKVKIWKYHQSQGLHHLESLTWISWVDFHSFSDQVTFEEHVFTYWLKFHTVLSNNSTNWLFFLFFWWSVSLLSLVYSMQIVCSNFLLLESTFWILSLEDEVIWPNIIFQFLWKLDMQSVSNVFLVLSLNTQDHIWNILT